MGREHFASLHTKVGTLATNGNARRLLFYGTMGFGKSFTIAALVFLLLHNKHRVIYIPTCVDLLPDRVEYFRAALFLAFSDDADIEIIKTGTEDDLIRLCQATPDLIFVVDQWNALDVVDAMDPDGEKKRACESMIERAACNGRFLRAASANNDSVKKTRGRQDSTDKLPVFGGLTNV